jgi:hypothetical protein
VGLEPGRVYLSGAVDWDEAGVWVFGESAGGGGGGEVREENNIGARVKNIHHSQKPENVLCPFCIYAKEDIVAPNLNCALINSV